jgi:hypothetical protein
MRSHEMRLVALFCLLVVPPLLWPLRSLFTWENLKVALVMALMLGAAMAVAVVGIMAIGRAWALLTRQ